MLARQEEKKHSALYILKASCGFAIYDFKSVSFSSAINWGTLHHIHLHVASIVTCVSSKCVTDMYLIFTSQDTIFLSAQCPVVFTQRTKKNVLRYCFLRNSPLNRYSQAMKMLIGWPHFSRAATFSSSFVFDTSTFVIMMSPVIWGGQQFLVFIAYTASLKL